MAISAQQEMALIAPPFGDYSTGRPMAVLRSVNGVNRLEYPIGTGIAIGMSVVDRAGRRTWLGAVSGQNTTGETASLCWNPKGTEIWFLSFDPSEPGFVYAVDLQGRRRVALRLPTQIKLCDIARNGDLLLSTGSMQLGILGKAPEDTAERDLCCLDSGKVAEISDDGRVVAANITGESGGEKGSVDLRKTDGAPATRGSRRTCLQAVARRKLDFRLRLECGWFAALRVVGWRAEVSGIRAGQQVHGMGRATASRCRSWRSPAGRHRPGRRFIHHSRCWKYTICMLPRMGRRTPTTM